MPDSSQDRTEPDVGAPGFALPPDAVPPRRAVQAPAPGSTIRQHNRVCFGCGVGQPTGLHVVATAGADVSVTATFTIGEAHQGAPGLAHGGIVAALMDDCLGFLAPLMGKPSVTAKLDLTYRCPIPVGHTLHVRAGCTGVAGRKIYGHAVAHLDAPEGPVAAEAAALFVEVDLEHFRPHLPAVASLVGTAEVTGP